MHGGQLLVKALAAHEVDHVFCVAGESYLPALDGLLDFPGINVVTCRHESGATFMAEAYGNLHARPGVAFVTRGPGACNASIGVHAAHQASSPLVMFVGLVGIADRDKEAFQEFDLKEMYGSLAKWVAVIDDSARIPEYVARAFHLAQSGRPGPVVIGLPEEVLFSDVEDQAVRVIPPVVNTVTAQDVARVCDVLGGAQRPVVLVGGGGWSDEACGALHRFSEQNDLPVAVSFRRHDIFDHGHGNYIGELGTGTNPALVQRVKDADVVLIIGARLSEITTQGYSIFHEGQRVVHVYPDASIFGQSVLPDFVVQSDQLSFLSGLCEASLTLSVREWRDVARADYEQWSGIEAENNTAIQGADMTQVFRQLRDVIPRDAITVMGVGNFSGWCQRYLRYGRPGRLLGCIAGAMGYGVAAAVGASIVHPEKTVVGIVGDGGFMMSASEMATALHHGAKPILIVCNNGIYGTIRMHQEKHYPGRVSATGLSNPDFVKLAESYGAFAARVEHADDFTDVWQAAVDSGRMALIEIAMDPRQISTQTIL